MNALRRSLAATTRIRFPIAARNSVRPIATQSYSHFEKAVSTIQSAVDTSAPEFKENAAQMAAVTNSLRVLHEQIKLGGPEVARTKHVQRKKMLPRE